MKVEEALKALREKKTVRRRSTGQNVAVLLVREEGYSNGREKLVSPGSTGNLEYVIPVLFDWDDLNATDWEVVE